METEVKDTKREVEKELTEKLLNNGKGGVRTATEKNGPMICTVCNLSILPGQAYKVLPSDGQNGKQRFYHDATCSPGSPNWVKFRGGKAKIKVSKKKARIAAKAAKAAKPSKGKGPKREAGKTGGYNPGTQIFEVHRMIKAGSTLDQIASGLKKAFPKATGNLRTNAQWYIGKIRKDGHEITLKDGTYRFAAK